MRPALFCVTSILLCGISLRAQDPNATVSGRVLDPSGAAVPGTQVMVINDGTNIGYSAVTNDAGIYSLASVPPGKYHIQVSKNGFKNIIKPDVTLHVQDAPTLNFTLEVGAASESVTVEGGTPLINTESAAVSTVIDRTFVQSLPLNGRSFNTLLQLSPGVVITPVSSLSGGQFSISGQRTSANIFSVDGVSANFGVAASSVLGDSGTGTSQAFSVIGGTSSLASVDALEEFRIETSSFAPEFGRAPGGQVSLTTRSGTNTLHGGVFEYFRNDVLDANDWFNNSTTKIVPRPPERHNDFGGFLGGAIWRDKAFFFFSYEGARLRVPQTINELVPSANARAGSTSPAIPAAALPLLAAFPMPNGPVTPDGFAARFTGNYSNKDTLNATSIRVDHSFNSRFSIFGRYNYAPSSEVTRPSKNDFANRFTNTQTLTAGANIRVSARVSNTLRGNYSRQTVGASLFVDSFGGATPPSLSSILGSLALPTTELSVSLTNPPGSYAIGPDSANQVSQLNFVDGLGVSTGRHELKFGVDYRDIFLNVRPRPVFINIRIPSLAGFASTGNVNLSTEIHNRSQFLAQAFSAYTQDTWKATPRLSLTYGVRWELAPAPSGRGTTTVASWTNTNNPSQIGLAPAGTPLWATTYGNFAPRFGLAYSLNQRGDFVVRVGGGIFYDLGAGESGTLAFAFPNSASKFVANVPVSTTDFNPFLPPPISRQPPFTGGIVGFAGDLKPERSYQWNISLEKSLVGKQALSATYVGQAGRDLQRVERLFQPNANFTSFFDLTQTTAEANYNALQLQYRRPLSSHIQALLNYTWSHSLDNSSNDTAEVLPQGVNVISGLSDYASSDFDIQHVFSGAVTYSLPTAWKSGPLSLLTRDWSLDALVVARSGFPFNARVSGLAPDGDFTTLRPNRVPGQPSFVTGSSCFAVDGPPCPGGKGLNPAAFALPTPGHQGSEARNDIRGFGLSQVDLSIARKFALTERLNLSFRTDAFNVLNHPNFSNPSAFIIPGLSFLLESTSMLNNGLGGLSSLFQQGGPRSLQLSLRMTF